MVDLAAEYFFLAYAAPNFQHHANLAGEDLQVWNAFQTFLKNDPGVSLWLMLCLYDGSLSAQREWHRAQGFWNSLVVPPPIHISVLLRNKFLTIKLVENGAKINALNTNWKNAGKQFCRPTMSAGGTVLHSPDLDPQLRLDLLKLGAHMNTRDSEGMSTIGRAINDQDKERVLMLLESAKNARGRNSSPGYEAKVLNEAARRTMQSAVAVIMNDPLMDLGNDDPLQ